MKLISSHNYFFLTKLFIEIFTCIIGGKYPQTILMEGTYIDVMLKFYIIYPNYYKNPNIILFTIIKGYFVMSV